MASIFTKIIDREIPGYIVAENDEAIAFLDINPLKHGHTLVVPKKEVDQLFDLDKETYQSLQSFAYEVAQAIAKAIPCVRVGVAVIGLEVPHAHIHLIPLDTMDDINFSRKKLNPSQQELLEVAQKIAKHF
jgi:histidine triad (HIT) family protein